MRVGNLEAWLARYERAVVATLLLAAVVIRLVIAHYYGAFQDVSVAEASNVALAYAHTGSLADAYFPGQGPTAHLAPVAPMIAGTIHRLFADSVIPAWSVLLGWSLVQVTAGFLLLFMLARKLEISRLASMAALSALCLIPVLPKFEVEEFRYWEGALAVALGCGNLVLIMIYSKIERLTFTKVALASVVAAFTLLVSAAAGLAVYACWSLFALRRGFSATLRMGLIAALMLALVMGPWIIRNYLVFDRFIPFRSDFGMVLALGFYPAALSDPDPGKALVRRLREVHPMSSPRAAAEVRRVGEVAYSKTLEQQTKAWMIQNPEATARLMLRHLSQFYAPGMALSEPGDSWRIRRMASLLIPLANVLGLLAIGVGLAKRQPGFDYVGIYVMVTGLPYMLAQPVFRYTYLVYGALLICAAGLIVDGLTRPALARLTSNPSGETRR